MAPKETKVPSPSDISDRRRKDQLDSYLAGLEHEKAGYEAKAKGATARGDKDLVSFFTSRAKDVQTEHDRAKKAGLDKVTGLHQATSPDDESDAEQVA
ncbi:MAG TPA: hypothetical protein VEN82_01695 [Actinomycetota bacterium]|nr:hypothetical protein [Actinomycetota bacterium]